MPSSITWMPSRGTGVALSKLRGLTVCAGFTEREVALFDEIIVDDAQCGR